MNELAQSDVGLNDGESGKTEEDGPYLENETMSQEPDFFSALPLLQHFDDDEKMWGEKKAKKVRKSPHNMVNMASPKDRGTNSAFE